MAWNGMAFKCVYHIWLLAIIKYYLLRNKIINDDIWLQYDPNDFIIAYWKSVQKKEARHSIRCGPI